MPKRRGSKAKEGQTRILKEARTVERAPDPPAAPSRQLEMRQTNSAAQCKYCGSTKVRVINTWPGRQEMTRETGKDERGKPTYEIYYVRVAKRRRYCQACGRHFWSREVYED